MPAIDGTTEPFQKPWLQTAFVFVGKTSQNVVEQFSLACFDIQSDTHTHTHRRVHLSADLAMLDAETRDGHVRKERAAHSGRRAKGGPDAVSSSRFLVCVAFPD